MIQTDIFSALEKHADEFHPVVPFNAAKDRIVVLDLSKTNTGFTETVYENTDVFSTYINEILAVQKAKYLIQILIFRHLQWPSLSQQRYAY